MEPMISIIIPVYQAENYLERCIESVIRNIYNSECSCEIILIDDGSTDQSGLLCDMLTSSYDSVLVRHTENRGISAARNLGLALSKGEYIAFCDADDFWLPDSMSKNLLSKLGVYDVICFGYCRTGPNGNILQFHHLEEATSTGGDKFMQKNIGTTFVWSHFYKRQLLLDNEIRFFESVHYMEDVMFNTLACYAAESICAVSDVMYGYRNNPQSCCNTMELERKFQSIIAGRQLETEYMRRHYPQKPEIALHFQNVACYNVIEFCKYFFWESPSVRNCKAILSANHWEKYLDEIDQYQIPNEFQNEYNQFTANPYLYAWRNFLYGRIRAAALKILPEKLSYRLKK